MKQLSFAISLCAIAYGIAILLGLTHIPAEERFMNRQTMALGLISLGFLRLWLQRRTALQR